MRKVRFVCLGEKEAGAVPLEVTHGEVGSTRPRCRRTYEDNVGDA